jgi:hypothetical protein
MLSTPWAEFLQLDSLRVVASILCRVISSLAAINTTQIDDDAVISPSRHIYSRFLLSIKKAGL